MKLADPESYFTVEWKSSGRFTWDVSSDEEVFADPEELQDMTPSDVLSFLFSPEDAD